MTGRLTNEDCPDVDKDKEHNVSEFLQRKEEGEHVVRDTLGPSVQGVKGMTGKWCRHDPLVMWLV